MDAKVLSDKLGLSFLAEPWLLQVFLIISTTAPANIVSRFLLRRAEKLASNIDACIDDLACR